MAGQWKKYIDGQTYDITFEGAPTHFTNSAGQIQMGTLKKFLPTIKSITTAPSNEQQWGYTITENNKSSFTSGNDTYMMIGWTYRITFGSSYTPTMGATISNFWSGGGEATGWSGGSDMRIRLQVDNEYDLYMTESGDGPWLYIGGGNSWYKMGDITIPNWTGSKKLKMWSRNYTGPAAWIGHVDYLGETYKTGTAAWKLIMGGDWVIKGSPGSSPGPWGTHHPNTLFTNTDWIWASDVSSNQELAWSWKVPVVAGDILQDGNTSAVTIPTVGDSVTFSHEPSNSLNVASISWSQITYGGAEPISGLPATGNSVTFQVPFHAGEDGGIEIKMVATGPLGETDTKYKSLQFAPAADAIPEITVHSQNDAQVPNGTIFYRGDAVRLSGRNSQFTQTYTWEQTNGPPVEALNINGSEVNFIIPFKGSAEDELDYDYNQIRFNLLCTNIEDEPVAVDHFVIVQHVPAPQPDIAISPGVDNDNVQLPIYSEDTVLLSGDASITTENFEWAQVAGPPVTLANTSEPNTSVLIPAGNAGQLFKFKLKATNTEGLETTITKEFEIQERPLSTPHITKISNNIVNEGAADDWKWIARGETVTLSAAVASLHAEQFEFYQFSGEQIQFQNPTSPITSFVVPANITPGSTIKLGLNTWNLENIKTEGSDYPYDTAPEPDWGGELTFTVIDEPAPVLEANNITMSPSANPLPGANVQLSPNVTTGNVVRWEWSQTDGPIVQLQDITSENLIFTVPMLWGADVIDAEETQFTFEVVGYNSEDDVSNAATIVVQVDVPEDPWAAFIPNLDNDEYHDNKVGWTNFNKDGGSITDVLSYFYDTTLSLDGSDNQVQSDWAIPRYLEQFDQDNDGYLTPTDAQIWMEHERQDVADAITWFIQHQQYPPGIETAEFQLMMPNVVEPELNADNEEIWPSWYAGRQEPAGGWKINDITSGPEFEAGHGGAYTYFLEEYDIDGSGGNPTQADVSEWMERGRPDIAAAIQYFISTGEYPLSSGYVPPPPDLPGATIFAKIIAGGEDSYANPQQSGSIGQTIYLDASSATGVKSFVTDPVTGESIESAEGSLTYQWIQTKGTSGTIINSNTDYANFTIPTDAMNEELYEFKLQVTNSEGLTEELEHGDNDSDINTIDLAIKVFVDESYWQSFLGGPESINRNDEDGTATPGTWGYYNIIENGESRKRYYEEFNISGDGNLNLEDIETWYEHDRSDVGEAIQHFLATNDFPPSNTLQTPDTYPFVFTVHDGVTGGAHAWPSDINNIITVTDQIQDVAGLSDKWDLETVPPPFILPSDLENFNEWVTPDSDGYRYTTEYPGAPVAVARLGSATNAMTDLVDWQADDEVELKTLEPGTTVYLDGFDSLNESTYFWYQVAGPSVELINHDTSNPYFVIPADIANQVVLTFELRVANVVGIESAPSSVSIDVYTPEGFWANYLRGIADDPSVSYYGSRTYDETWLNNHPSMPPYGNLDFVGEPMVFYYEDFKLTPGSDITQADIEMWASVGRDDIVDAIYYFIATSNFPPHRPPAPPPPDDYIHFPGHVPAGLGTSVQEDLTLNQMVDVLHAEGYTNWSHLDVNEDGIIDETDGEAIIQSTLEASQAAGHSPALGDARPLDFIRQVYITNQTIMFEIYFPISGEYISEEDIADPPSFDSEPFMTVPPGSSKQFHVDDAGEMEGHEMITRTRIRPVPYFSDGKTSTLQGRKKGGTSNTTIINDKEQFIWIASEQSQSNTNNPYYFNVMDGLSTASRSDVQFSVTFGHYAGSGSYTAGNQHKGATEAIYKQYSALLLPYSESKHKNTYSNFFHISSGSEVNTNQITGNPDEFIYVLNFKRSRFKDQLQAGTWTMVLSGSLSTNNVSPAGQIVLKLTDDSVDTFNPTQTPAGVRYNIVSGSAGIVSKDKSNFGRYGYIYPEVGIMIFGEKIADKIPGDITGTQTLPIFDGPGGGGSGVSTDSNYGLNPVIDRDENCMNPIKFINCMRNVSANTGNNSGVIAVNDGFPLTLYGEKEETVVTYAVRLTAQEFNHTTNLSIVSSSGQFMSSADPGRKNGFNTGISGSINPTHQLWDDSTMTGTKHVLTGSNYPETSTMDGDPHAFVTQIQLYGDAGTPIAVANLSKPMKKNSLTEGVIKVQLSY